MTITYLEAVDTLSPSKAGFSIEGGRAEHTYYVSPLDLEAAITQILGTSAASSASTGKLERLLPRAHPQFPWLYASAITEIRGCGHYDPSTGLVGGLVAAGDTLEAPPITSQYHLYPKYALRVEFTSKPYAVLGDSVIAPYDVSWCDPATGSTTTQTVYPEWLRYTDWPYDDDPEIAYAQHGQMKFRTAAGAPDGYTFPGFPRVVLPKGLIRFQWYQVPYVYLVGQKSILTKYVGYVNQGAWYIWNAGELLYRGVKTLRRYTPPVPDRLTWGGSTLFSTAKLVDLELTFEVTKRTIGSSVSPSPAWKVAAGHNLQPWIYDGKFYYVETTQASTSDRQPLYKSIPFEFLFQNPDSLP